MLEPDAILREARRWLGTPYQHQAQLIGHGVDCAQLVIAVGLALGLLDDDARGETQYGRLPNPKRAADAVARHLRRIEEPRPGDVLFIEWRPNVPTHLAFLAAAPAGYPTMIHACGDSGRVVEHRIDSVWARRINSAWRFRGLSDVH